MTDTQEIIAPAAGIEALQAQLHDVEDSIGRIAITWRQAAANPAALEAAAERLTVLERQRDLLRRSLEQVQHEQAALAADENGRRVRELIERARQQVMPMLDARVEKGRQLEDAVLQVAQLIRELHEQAGEIRREWPRDARTVSGLDPSDASFRALDATNLHVSIGQMLAWRLGSLWGEERAMANREESVLVRMQHEVGPIRYAFEEGVKQRIASL